MKTFILKTSLILFCFFSLAAGNAQFYIDIDVPAFTIEVEDPEQVPTCYIFAIALEVESGYSSLLVDEPCTLTLSYLFPQTSFYNVPINPFNEKFRVHVVVTRMPSGIQYDAYSEWEDLPGIEAGVNPDPIRVYLR